MSGGVNYPAGAPPKRGHGCLWGCLITGLVLVVVLVGGGAAAYFLGRAYIGRHLPAWEDRYPAVGLAVDLLQVRDEFTAAGRQAQGTAARLEGADDKSLMPGDVPLYADPLLETYSVSDSQATGFQRLSDSPEAVLAHLQEAMPADGWELLGQQGGDEDRLLVWGKGERTCQTEIVARDGDTELWLRCSL